MSAAKLPLALFGVQLALNVLWSCIFFGLEMPGFAFVEVLLLWLAIAATMVTFWQWSMIAGLLFVPYLAWVSFASCAELHDLAVEHVAIWPTADPLAHFDHPPEMVRLVRLHHLAGNAVRLRRGC